MPIYLKKNMIRNLCFFLHVSGFIFVLLVNFGYSQVNYYGHRGCRGILPENSIPAFQKALEMGADGIELDVVVNKDEQLVVSHEPYFKKEFCSDSTGNEIKNEQRYNTFLMTQNEIRKFDCGAKGNPGFPEQKRLPVTKPLLQEVFEQVNLAGKTLLLEVKSEAKEYSISQPHPKEFAQLVFSEAKKISANVKIYYMSFDPKILEELYALDTTIQTVYLTYSPFKSVRTFLREIQITPTVLGMFYPTISKRNVHRLANRNIQTFAWTVNKEDVSEDLLVKGVTGIITDYPDRVRKHQE
jgi:glycerophosphoryl diester phosphodiesterase